MSRPYYERLVAERAELADKIDALLQKAADEKRQANLLPDEDKDLKDWETRAAKLDREIAEEETRQRANEKLVTTIRRSQEEEREERSTAEQRGKPKPETRSAGQIFTESEAFKDYTGHGHSDRVEFAGFLEERAAITSADFDWLPKQQITINTPEAPTPFLGAINREPVSFGSFEYLTWPLAPVAGGPIAEGQPKPEATIGIPEPVPATLGTYAHWVQLSRQVLEDVPRIQAIVEGKLRQGLSLKLQQEALTAFNAGAFGAAAGTGLAGVREAIGTLEGAGYSAGGLLLNPADYAAIDVEAATGSNSGPVSFGRIWGLTPIPVPGIAAGTAYVGDLKTAMTWFDRNVTAVYLTDSYTDYFVRNLFVILAETRAAFAVTDPNAVLSVGLGDAGAEAAPLKASTSTTTTAK